MNFSAFFLQWRRDRAAQHDKAEQERLLQVKQSLRPHNTPEWFELGLYLREWFFAFPTVDKCVYGDAATLLSDIEARFPGTKFINWKFTTVLVNHYGLDEKGVTFTREDIMASYTHARSFEELDRAKALQTKI